MTPKHAASFLLALLVTCATSCSTAPAKKDADQFNRETAAVVQKLSASNPKLAQLFDVSEGYVVFPVVGEGGLLIATGWGRGAVYQEGDLIGYATVSEHSIGAVLGGEKWTLLIFFQNESALEEFEKGKFAWNAKADAVAADAGANTSTNYRNGVLLVRVDPAGLMGNASAGFSNYKYVPLDEAFKKQ